MQTTSLLLRLERLSKGLSLVLMGMGAMVLTGWVFQIEPLKSILPDWPPMKIPVAIGFILSGFSLWLFHREGRSKTAVLAGRICSGCVLLIAGLTFVADVSDIETRHPHWLFEMVFAEMSWASTVNILLMGVALLCLQFGKHRVAQGAALMALAIAFLGFLGLFYDVQFLSHVPLYATMAFHSSIGVILFCVALLFACPQNQLMRTYVSGGGGVMIRRLLPFIIGCPLVFGWLRLQGQRTGWYGTEFGVAVFVLAMIVSLGLVIWTAGKSLNRAEAERLRAADDLRQSEAELREMANAMPQIVWTAQPDGKLHYCNTKWFDYSGFSQERTDIKEHWEEILHPDDVPDVLEKWLQSLRLGRPHEVEVRFKDRLTGGYRWHLMRALPVRDADGNIFRWVGTFTDIHHQKIIEAELEKAQKELRVYSRELEVKVAQRTVKLESTVESLQTFIYTIAHDLRAPLRAMQGFTLALLEEQSAQMDDTGKDYCHRINGAAHRMDKLIFDLLEYGRLAHTEFSLQPVDVADEIDLVLRDLSEEISRTHAEVQVDTPLPRVCGDAKMLDQIFSNLVANALKFVPPHVPPKIHIFSERHDGNVRLYVEDNGIGIAPEHKERVFGIFQRLHTNETYPGTGIGLAIVQKGVEQMGGQVGVESDPGKGSRFWIELPDKEHCVTHQAPANPRG